MKVLLVNGSPRRNGNTSIALAKIAKQLSSLGIDSETAWIGNKPVRGCIACNKCKDGPGACVFDDDVCNGISAKMNDADALIVGSPVYWGQQTGLYFPSSSGCSIPMAKPLPESLQPQSQSAGAAEPQPHSRL